MELLILAALVFLLGHMAVSSTPLRPTLVGRLGERAYMGLYSVAALAAIVWLSMEYAAAPKTMLWMTGPALRGLTGLVMPFALLAIVAGVSAPNPMSAGQTVRPEAKEPARGILRVTRHPANWGIALWAAAHVVANGDAPSLIFFGAILLLALLGSRLQERRKAAELGAQWERFAAVTSFVPFAAILGGRNRWVWREIGWKRLLVTVALYVALLAGGHQWLFGVRPY